MEPTRILVTGSTDGIGLETACELAELGHRVIVHGRSNEKAASARKRVASRASANVSGGEAGGAETVIGDLSSLKEVDAMAREINERFPDLRVVVANAGVTTKTRRESVDGHELTFAVNHLAHFLLINRLVNTLKANVPSRIVVVSSMVHRSGQIHFDDLQLTRGFSGSDAYSQSKLANLLFAFELARRLEGTGVTVNGLHPGVISTKLLHVNFSGGAPVSAGAKTPVYLATADDLKNVTGKYFENRRETSPAKAGLDVEAARRLWDLSEELIESAVNT